MQLSHADEFTSKNLRFKDGPRKAGLSLLLMGYPSVIVRCDSHTSTVSVQHVPFQQNVRCSFGVIVCHAFLIWGEFVSYFIM